MLWKESLPKIFVQYRDNKEKDEMYLAWSMRSCFAVDKEYEIVQNIIEKRRWK